MKKVLSLLTLLLAVCSGAWADGEDLIVSWNTTPTTSNDSEGCSPTGTSKNLATWADGTKIKIMRSDKGVSNGNNITIGSTSYKTIKVSNGAQNKLIMPSGKKAYAVSIYSYVNKDSGNTAWAEVNGDTSQKTDYMVNFNNAGSPDHRFYKFDDEGISEFTFTNSGQQLCYVLVIYTAAKTASALAFAATSGTYDMKDGTAIDLAVTSKTPAEAAITYSSSDATVASVNSSTGAVTLLKAGTTTITASFAGNASYYPSTATYDLTVVNSAVNTISVAYDISGASADGTAPATFDINEGETFTIPANQTLYKAGYTLTAWNDGSTNHTLGATVTAGATDITLTPVFTANDAAAYLGHNASTATWQFGESNGAPSWNSLQGSGKEVTYVTQTTIGGKTIDVKMLMDPTSGKIDNYGRGDALAQLNGGTKLTVPAITGATIEFFVYKEGETAPTFGGNIGTYDSSNKIYSYTVTADGDIDVVVGDQGWASKLVVTYPSESAVLTVAGNNTDIALTKANIETWDYLSVTTDGWQTGKTYGGYSGDFVNMSKAARFITAKVSGASTFEVFVQNSTAGRTYLVKIGDNAATEVTHPGTGVVSSGVFAIADPLAETTLTLSGGGTTAGSVYPVYIKFNPTVPVTLATSGKSTFASQYAIDCASLPAGLKAYKVSAVSTTSATLTEVTEAVAAGTGLILIGTGSASYDIPVAATGTDISASNELVGVTADKALTAGDAFLLSNGKFVPCTDGTLKAGKAYLPNTTGARSLSLVFEGETTGINAIENAETINGIFNLNGQRVSQPTKGLYIVNGRKVVIK